MYYIPKNAKKVSFDIHLDEFCIDTVNFVHDTGYLSARTILNEIGCLLCINTADFLLNHPCICMYYTAYSGKFS